MSIDADAHPNVRFAPSRRAQRSLKMGRVLPDAVNSRYRPEVAGHDRPLPGNAMSILANLLVYPVGDTLAQCDPFGIPSTSHWTGAAIIVQ